MSGCGCEPGRPCGCCEGIRALTPVTPFNRPGLPAITYRMGTHGAFLATMKARLSSADFPALAGLRTRESSDPAIALLDAWACVADVLTFYQERIANEGYLRTATERRSVLELAALVGSSPRPGVAASVYFAYTLENGSQQVVIPAGARAQSIPDPGETAQSFETSDDLEAHSEWSLLKPRPSQPQQITYDYSQQALSTTIVHLKGTATKLNPGDGLVFDFNGARLLRHVQAVKPDFTAQRTEIVLQEAAATKAALMVASTTGGTQDGKEGYTALDVLSLLTPGLSRPATAQLASAANLARPVAQVFNATADIHPQLLARFHPQAASLFYVAWQAPFAGFTYSQLTAVYAMRSVAGPFGTTAGKTPNFDEKNKVTSLSDWAPDGEGKDLLYLDAVYGTVAAGSPVAIRAADGTYVHSSVKAVEAVARSAYGLNGKSSRLDLAPGTWAGFTGSTIADLRQTLVYAGAEALELAELPLDDLDVGGDRITLDGLYAGFKAGRWVIVGGERTDVRLGTSTPVPGIQSTELAMIAGVLQDLDLNLSGDTVHTTILLARPLAYTYKRATTGLFGNVVLATHGETRAEVLGGGTGGPLQTFILKQPPLTFVSASNADGVASTLQVRVNEVLWHEAKGLAGLTPRDRAYLTRTDNEGKTSVIFGTGARGVRPPTGLANIAAVYRNGIGAAGNVKAGQISLLASKPLGVKAVVNPLRASGGAGPDTRDQARANTPLATLSLDRLVSVRDYADFARTFGGVGKAAAARLTDGARQVIHVTLAGVDDAPIDPGSTLLANLAKAFRACGDPFQAVQLEARDLRLMVLSAGVKVAPDYLWAEVLPRLRAALLEAFGFDRRDLAQPAYLSEVIRVIQGVQGVAWADVDVLDSVPEGVTSDDLGKLAAQLQAPDQPHARVPTSAARVDPTAQGKRLRPAQLAFLSPELPDTLILKELP